MTVIEELAGAWGEFVEMWRTYDGPRERRIALAQADGGEETVYLAEQGEDWWRVCRSADEIAFQERVLADPLQCVRLLRATVDDSQGRDKPNTLFPEGVRAVRRHLIGAGLEPPEVDLWEVYRPVDSKERS